MRLALERNEFEVHYQPIVDRAPAVPSAPRRCSARATRCTATSRRSSSSRSPRSRPDHLHRKAGSPEGGQSDGRVGPPADGASPRHRSRSTSRARQLEDDDSSRSSVPPWPSTASTPPARLEVTESVASPTRVDHRALDEAVDLGLRVAIDDFKLRVLLAVVPPHAAGDRPSRSTGRSSSDWTSRRLDPVVQAILEMSHATGLGVIAEGVSDMDLQARVSTMGCDAAQGYFWARPMPADDFARWWSEGGEIPDA